MVLAYAGIYISYRNGVIEIKAEIIPKFFGGKDRIIYKDKDEDGDWDYIAIDFGNNGKINDVIKE